MDSKDGNSFPLPLLSKGTYKNALGTLVLNLSAILDHGD